MRSVLKIIVNTTSLFMWISLYTLCMAFFPSPSTCEEANWNDNNIQREKCSEKSVETVKNSQTFRLTLDNCYEIALEESPRSIAVEEGMFIAQGNVGKVKASQLPELKALADASRWRKRFYPPSGLPFSFIGTPVVGPLYDLIAAIDLRYVVYDGGGKRARLLAAMAQNGAATFEVEKVRQDILRSVAQAFYNLSATEDMYCLAKKELERADVHLKLATDRVQAGTSQLSDKLRAQVEVANAKMTLASALSQYTIAKGQLNIAMGWPPDECIEIIDYGCSCDYECLDLCQAQEAAIGSRPEIQQAIKQLFALRQRIHETDSYFKPKVTARGSYGVRDDRFPPNEREWYVGMAVEMPLLSQYAHGYHMSVAKGEWRKARAEYDQLVLVIREEVVSGYARLTEAFQLIEASKAQVEQAQENMRMAEERYRVGAGTVNDLLDSSVILAEAETNYIKGIWNYKSAYIYFIWSQGIPLYLPPCED